MFWNVLARLLEREDASAFAGFDAEVRAFVAECDRATLPAYLAASSRHALTLGLTLHYGDEDLVTILERYCEGEQFV